MFCRLLLSPCVFLTVFILPFVMAHWSNHHQEVARRGRGDVDIYKRQYYSNSRFTWYDVGLGACGATSAPSDFIVALTVQQYGPGYPGPYCFKSITIQYGGKTAVATIVDECMGCPYGGLDFSEGLFSYFTSLGDGVIYGAWWFNDEQTPTSTWEQPTTSSTPAYTPPTTSDTPTYAPSPTTSSTPTYTPSPTTSSSTTSPKTSSTTSSINLSTGWASGLAIPTGGMVPTPDSNNPENIFVFYNVMIESGIMLTMAGKCG